MPQFTEGFQRDIELLKQDFPQVADQLNDEKGANIPNQIEAILLQIELSRELITNTSELHRLVCTLWSLAGAGNRAFISAYCDYVDNTIATMNSAKRTGKI